MLALETTLLTETRRSAQTLAEQTALVVSFLRGQLSDDDRAAVASRGWRPVSWTPDPVSCPAADCKTAHDHSPHPHTPRWQAEIDHAIDAWPKYLLIGVPVALAQLSKIDREVVDLVGTRWMSFRGAGSMLRKHHATIREHYDGALEQVCRAVWDEVGQPYY